MGLDRPSTYVFVPTVLGTHVRKWKLLKSSFLLARLFQAHKDSLATRLKDVALTMATYLIAVIAFYGTWKSEDFYFDDLELEMDVRVRNAAMTAVSKRSRAI